MKTEKSFSIPITVYQGKINNSLFHRLSLKLIKKGQKNRVEENIVDYTFFQKKSENIKVCQLMFLNTLSVSLKQVRNTVEKKIN